MKLKFINLSLPWEKFIKTSRDRPKQDLTTKTKNQNIYSYILRKLIIITKI